jgi:hypothetical protein
VAGAGEIEQRGEGLELLGDLRIRKPFHRR